MTLPAKLRALADECENHSEPWLGDGDDGYQCAGCQRDLYLRSSEYEPRGLCDQCVEALLPALVEALKEAAGEIERLEGDEAVMKLSRMMGLGDPVRPDIHAVACRKRDAALARVKRLEALVEESARWIESTHYRVDDRVHKEYAASLRKELSDGE